MDMIRTQVYFEENQLLTLKRLAKQENKKFSVKLREIIDECIEKKKKYKNNEERQKAWREFIGYNKTKGHRYLSRDIDKILY